MHLNRCIGRWSLTALMINAIIGSGIFGMPDVLLGTLGRASPIAMILAGLVMAVILLCVAEVGSRFSESGGVYLYAGTAFGNFAGLQVGWFWFLSVLGAAAANANLFITHLGAFAPWAAHGWQRGLVLTALLLVPAVANYQGTRTGTILSNILTCAKLLPLLLLGLLGALRFSRHAELVPLSEVTAPGWSMWISALLLLSYVYGGFEDALAATGEVRQPSRSIPLALITALSVCMLAYTLLQFVVVATPGGSASERPSALAATAQVLLGRGGAWFVEGAAMIATYGWISASLLNAPRFLFSMASHGEFPKPFGRLHLRFNTPYISILIFAALAWILSLTSTFSWCLALSAGAGIVFYGVVCAALPRLRRIQPHAAAFRLPCGTLFSFVGLTICVVLLSRIHLKEVFFMTITAGIAAANWWWARRRAGMASAGPMPAGAGVGAWTEEQGVEM